MKLDLPFSLPKVYRTYVERFERHPDDGIDKLLQLINKRGEDPLGLCLLCIFYQQNAQMPHALSIAAKLRYLVPGSSFYLSLAYRLQHPDGFEAWLPEEVLTPTDKEKDPVFVSAPAEELDELIDALSQVENTRIDLSKNVNIDPDVDLSESSNEVNDIFTETLADIYMGQKAWTKAERVLLGLIKQHPERKKTLEEKLKLVQAKLNSKN